MVDKAGTKTSYYSNDGALVASLHPPLQRLAMVGCCVLCKAEAAAPPPAANQWQPHLENVFVLSQLGLIQLIYSIFWVNFSEYILSDLHMIVMSHHLFLSGREIR